MRPVVTWKIRSFGDLRHFQRSIRIRVEAIPLFQAEGGPTEASSILKGSTYLVYVFSPTQFVLPVLNRLLS